MEFWLVMLAMGWIAASIITALLLGAILHERDKHPY
jgi:hypothetical protein